MSKAVFWRLICHHSENPANLDQPPPFLQGIDPEGLDRTTSLLSQNLLHGFHFIFVVLGCGLI